MEKIGPDSRKAPKRVNGSSSYRPDDSFGSWLIIAGGILPRYCVESRGRSYGLCAFAIVYVFGVDQNNLLQVSLARRTEGSARLEGIPGGVI